MYLTSCAVRLIITTYLKTGVSNVSSRSANHVKHGLRVNHTPHTFAIRVNIIVVLLRHVHDMTRERMRVDGDFWVMQRPTTHRGGGNVVARSVVAQHHLTCIYIVSSPGHQPTHAILRRTVTSSCPPRGSCPHVQLKVNEDKNVMAHPSIVTRSKPGRPNSSPLSSMG